ncbi:MAG TPA: NADP-dependent oxidoreductase [Acidimicrobiia bacterium]|nr:NADP-dependent oxidoreductase [Acidimicrobiia bacterium]
MLPRVVVIFTFGQRRQHVERARWRGRRRGEWVKRSVGKKPGSALVVAREARSLSFVQAVRLRSPGGWADLVIEEEERPEPAETDVLIEVHAAALTRDELNWPVDRLPAIPSYEVSGIIAEVGAAVTGFEIGDGAYGLTGFERDGVAAEFAAIPADRLAHKPVSLSHVEASSLPLAGLSAMQGLFDHGRLEPGQRVLIHGGAGGVGSFAVQLAKVRGAHVIASAAGSRVSAAGELGSDEVIDHQEHDFTEVDPVDLVFDTVGGPRLARSPAVVRPGGRIVSVAERPPMGFGSEEGVESTFFIVEPNAHQLDELTRLADEGRLRVLVDSTFSLDRVKEAFQRLQSGNAVGKVVLTIHDD